MTKKSNGIGLDWYKREQAAYLKDVQGLKAREHAVYSIVLDLIYAHGGAVNNDPKFIAGWIGDMGSASVRATIESLIEREILRVDGDQLTQKRAQNEVKTRKKQDVFPTFSCGESNENNNITPTEKRREENPLTPYRGNRRIGVSDGVKRKLGLVK